MASVSVGECDFQAIVTAAWHAKERAGAGIRGAADEARALDVLARRLNAALSNAKATRMSHGTGLPRGPALTWRDLPSVFEPKG